MLLARDEVGLLVAGVDCQDFALIFEVVVDHPLTVGDCELRSTAELDGADLPPGRRINGCRAMAVTIEGEHSF
jgi:hypothetical protein